MRFQRFCYLAALTAFVGASLATADEKLDQIEKEVTAKWKSVKTMTGKMHMNMSMEQAGSKMSNSMEATVQYMRKGDKMMSRMEGTMKMTMGEQTMEMPMVAVSDGEISHQLIEQMGQKMCIKTKADSKETVGEEMFKSLREYNNITVLPDEDVDGDKCWVFEATPKQPESPREPSKTKYYIRQKDAAMVKMVGFDPSGKEFMTVTTTDIKYNEKLDPALFDFKVPEGVPVRDMTGGAGGAGGETP